MARIEKLNCSNCGASLEVDLDAQVILCRFCGTQLLLEVEKEKPVSPPGIITQKHHAEVKQWLDKLGIDKNIDPLEYVYDLNLEKKEIDFPDLKYLEYLPNIRVLQLHDSNIDDNGTPYLKVLKELEALYVYNTAISDLSFTCELTNLKSITAFGTSINDKGIEGIDNLKSLKKLNLGSTMVTDAGIKHIINIQTLESLDVSGTLVTIEGLKLLSSLPSLKEISYPKDIRDPELLRAGILRMLHVKTVINFSCAEIEDLELKELEIFRHIEMLDLRSNRITDAGLVFLKPHVHINYLNLSFNRITDAGIENLAGLTKIKTLDLRGNKITKEGVKRLKNLFRGANIDT